MLIDDKTSEKDTADGWKRAPLKTPTHALRKGLDLRQILQITWNVRATSRTRDRVNYRCL